MIKDTNLNQLSYFSNLKEAGEVFEVEGNVSLESPMRSYSHFTFYSGSNNSSK